MRLKASIFIFLGLTVFQAPSWTDDAKKTLSLKDCYALALKQSETIAIQQKFIEEAQGRFYQALSGILPDISFVYTERHQDGSNSTNFTLSKVPEAKFVLSQPLFSGFKEFAAIAASRAEKRQLRYEKQRAEELLFIDVSDAFYLYLSYQEEIDALQNVEKVLSERLEELNKRVNLGRSRQSEVASTEARLSRVQADIQDVLSQREVGRQLLEFLTGTSFDMLVDEAFEMKVESPDEYLDQVENRPDVLAAYESWQKLKKGIAVASSGFWPALTLDGNYYTKRVGNSSGVDWDATLTVDAPIFKGGENIGKRKEAKALAEAEELTYQKTRREAVLDVENAYTKLEMTIKREVALQKALEASEKNYTLQLEDYQKSLVNNLDVMQALEDWEDARRDYVSVKNLTKRLYWNFKIAAGEMKSLVK